MILTFNSSTMAREVTPPEALAAFCCLLCALPKNVTPGSLQYMEKSEEKANRHTKLQLFFTNPLKNQHLNFTNRD